MHLSTLEEILQYIPYAAILLLSSSQKSNPVIKCKDDIWFRGKTIAEILKCTNQRKAIRNHVDPEDRARFDELHRGTNRSSSLRASGSRGSKTDPLTNNEKNTIYINESELYSLILRSKLESARVFK